MPILGFFQNIGLTELIIIFAVLLLLFGATRIPQIARALGRSAREFKKGIDEDEQDPLSGAEEDTEENDGGSPKED